MSTIGGGMGLTAKSAMNENICKEGRKYGGCAILWKPSIKGKVTPIDSKHDRLCAVLMTMENDITVLFINAYMPCDGRQRDARHDEYVDVLNRVQVIMSQYDANYIVFGGDLNTDISRDTPHTQSLTEFISQYDMSMCTTMSHADVPYTFMCERNGEVYTSKIDHMIVNASLADKMNECYIIDKFMSDHPALIVSLDIEVPRAPCNDNAEFNGRKTAWYKATVNDIENYRCCIEEGLKNLIYDNSVFTCDDVFCTRHSNALQRLYDDILTVCLNATDKCIPHVKQGKQREQVIPGWNDYVKQHHEEALYWHYWWKVEGRPHHGHTAEMRRITRARYHRVRKMVMKDHDNIVKEKLAEAACNSNRDLWSEVKKLNASKKTSPICVDGCTDDGKIASIFNEKYETLYNSVPYNAYDMSNIKCKIDKRIKSCHHDRYQVNVNELVTAVKHLKTGKSDGEEGLYSDNIINAPHRFYVILTQVFNSMLVHGMCPRSMLVGTMIPIPKVKQQVVCESDNFRAIALSSILGKVLDWIILIKEEKSLCTSELQFGFKPGVSTTQCTHVVNETISYYNFNKTNVHMVLLDASKAFDRVKYCKLFEELLNRDISPIVLRLLAVLYTSQTLQVKWKSIKSDNFSVVNGVKQGGVLSPILFSVYVDGLLTRLKKSGTGCVVGNSYVGAISYADDLVLLAPTHRGVSRMITECELFADEYDIMFNAKKSKYMVFSGRYCNDVHKNDIFVNGAKVEMVDSADHLGHRLSSTDSNSMINAAVASFWKSFNMFMGNFSQCYAGVKSKLFRQYCCSFYGSPLWSLNEKDCSKICVAWRKALKVIWNIPHMTHRKLVALLSEGMPLELQLKIRFHKFVVKALEHKNSIVRHITEHACINPMSVCGRNWRDNVMTLSVNDLCSSWTDSVTIEDIDICNVIREMVAVREGWVECIILNPDDASAIINSLCTE